MHKTTTKLAIIATLLLLATTAHAAGTAINETGEKYMEKYMGSNLHNLYHKTLSDLFNLHL